MKEVVFEVDVAGEGAGIGVTSSTPPGEGEDGRRRKRRRCTNEYGVEVRGRISSDECS